MSLGWRQRIVVAAAAVCGLVGLGHAIAGPRDARAAARPPSASAQKRMLVLKLHFTTVPGGAMTGNRRLVFIARGPDRGVIIDGNTGKSRSLPLDGCGDTANAEVGWPYLVVGCGNGRVRLYNVTTDHWQDFTPSPELTALAGPYGCATGPQCVQGPFAIGSHWAALGFGQCEEHCPTPTVFQNLQTGHVVRDPTNRFTTVDLNSPSLAVKVCAPLTVPLLPRNAGDPLQWGSITFLKQRFAIRVGYAPKLVRCGSRFQEGLAPGPEGTPFNDHAIVWARRPNQIRGVFLPSGRRFQITVPSTIDPQYLGDAHTLVMTSRRIYYEDRDYQIWSAPAPAH